MNMYKYVKTIKFMENSRGIRLPIIKKIREYKIQ